MWGCECGCRGVWCVGDMCGCDCVGDVGVAVCGGGVRKNRI